MEAPFQDASAPADDGVPGPACFSELHNYAAGFLIKGIQQVGAGLMLEGLSFLRTARMTLTDGEASSDDVDLFTARCANFSAADFPEEFRFIPRDNATVGTLLENVLLKYYSSVVEVETLLQLGKFSDVPAVFDHLETAAASLDGAPVELKVLVSLRVRCARADLLIGQAKLLEAAEVLDSCLPDVDEIEALFAARGKLLLLKGKCAFFRGKFDESITLLKDAEATQKSIIARVKGKDAFEEGEDTDEVLASVRQAMAEAYLFSFRLPMAMGLLKQTLASRKPLLGIHHIQTIETNATLGHLFCKQFNIVKATACYNDIIELLGTPGLVAALGTDSLLLATCQLGKADCLRAVAKYDEAKNLYGSALRIRKLFYGDAKHPACAEVTEGNAVNMYLRARTYASAEPAINQCVDVCKSSLGEKHPQYARSLFRKGTMPSN